VAMTRSKASLALALTVVLWASAFPAIKVGLGGYGVAGLSVPRLAIASAALALAAPFLGVRRPRPCRPASNWPAAWSASPVWP
jgi:drug/metabolite transporter (DMT)-like permease